jgi:hypothetical protein
MFALFCIFLHSRIVKPEILLQANISSAVARTWLSRDLAPNKVASLRAPYDADCNLRLS